MKRLFLGLFLLSFIGGFAFVSTLNFGTAQTYTDVAGVVRSDTTWEKINSPYRLTGPVAVNDGIKLTIEPGVQVYFNTNTYMQVNGTLVAKGSDNDPIYFLSEGEIRFMPSSESWNEKTGTGTIIENGEIPSNEFKININGASPKIASSYSQAIITVNSGSPVFSNNQIYSYAGFTISDGSPVIINNKIRCRVIVKDGSPLIFNNIIAPGSYIGIEVTDGNPYISNNDITDFQIGIFAAYGIIERNYIHGGPVGVDIGNGIIRNNTISSATSISVQASSKPTISYNNFEFGNVPGRINIFLAEGANQDVDAAHNWWETTNETIINQSIFDNKNDFTLGTVNFVPFLTEANPQAMPDPNAPTPTLAPTPPPTDSPSTSPSPSQEPQQPDLTLVVGVAIVAVVLGAGLGLLVYLIKRK